LIFLILLVLAAVGGGIVASVAGFGIGSLLTPVFAIIVDPGLAVAAVSIPHFLGTALRFWMLRGATDRRVVWTFGLMSAAGGLAGALLHERASGVALALVFGALLVFVSGSELTGLARRIRFRGLAAWLAGGVSGGLGGLVGNQGGIRSAALLGFDLPKDSFVATATAIGLFVDGARMPVYFWNRAPQIASIWPLVTLAAAGVIAGTFLGRHVLTWIPERRFRAIVAVTIGLLGLAMLTAGTRPHPNIRP
jgi:uncharacterized membrane protein YfcA